MIKEEDNSNFEIDEFMLYVKTVFSDPECLNECKEAVKDISLAQLENETKVILGRPER